MPPEYDYDHITQLDAVELLTSRSSRIDFDAGEGLRLVVEAHSPGVFRLRCGAAAVVNDEKPSTRTRALADMLLARDEAVGEATIGPLDNAQGWRIAQGDIVMQIESSPLRFSLY
ncbi:MAG: glycoside hydrolase family 31 protein, partial [Comamonadaceae bacterium]